jgi:hypothetical protein
MLLVSREYRRMDRFFRFRGGPDESELGDLEV